MKPKPRRTSDIRELLKRASSQANLRNNFGELKGKGQHAPRPVTLAKLRAAKAERQD